ncbi:MAG: YgjV family protein [Rhodospirillales bacterium]|nr:YgjV family protein [Rhodospirillales bacterium]
MEYLPQTLGWIAAAFVVSSFQFHKLTAMIGMQIVGYGFLCIHFLMINALTGAAMSAIGIVRLLVAIWISSRPDVRQVYLLFLPIIWGACWLTFTSWVDFLPAAGYTLGTLAVYQREMLKTRLLFLAAHPFWLAYNLLVGSQGGIAMELANILSSSTAIIRHNRRRPDSDDVS